MSDEPNIDILLRDICGDDGLKEYAIETKYTLAVLIFQMQRQFMKDLELTTISTIGLRAWTFRQ